ncbi:hypothetical protein RFI_30728 [Reticulomyxa filosa]|uniref:Uncharacterized protein n=1 Tax=Reticulomyxa filosa TaxID=46433 RepID=X6LXI9_RETFI|nr:hypothetical protein RFI_30728 [Reticulomyxa filosa]|eukprot:ETO06663.1 hypothetical protein RFI_30728 [Reticulomyxa filosa]
MAMENPMTPFSLSTRTKMLLGWNVVVNGSLHYSTILKLLRMSSMWGDENGQVRTTHSRMDVTVYELIGQRLLDIAPLQPPSSRIKTSSPFANMRDNNNNNNNYYYYYYYMYHYNLTNHHVYQSTLQINRFDNEIKLMATTDIASGLPFPSTNTSEGGHYRKYSMSHNHVTYSFAADDDMFLHVLYALPNRSSELITPSTGLTSSIYAHRLCSFSSNHTDSLLVYTSHHSLHFVPLTPLNPTRQTFTQVISHTLLDLTCFNLDNDKHAPFIVVCGLSISRDSILCYTLSWTVSILDDHYGLYTFRIDTPVADVPVISHPEIILSYVITTPFVGSSSFSSRTFQGEGKENDVSILCYTTAGNEEKSKGIPAAVHCGNITFSLSAKYAQWLVQRTSHPLYLQNVRWDPLSLSSSSLVPSLQLLFLTNNSHNIVDISCFTNFDIFYPPKQAKEDKSRVSRHLAKYGIIYFVVLIFLIGCILFMVRAYYINDV